MAIPNSDNDVIIKVRKMLPNEKQKCLMIGSLLGVAGVLVQYVMEENKERLDKMPELVKYACAMVAGNMLAFISDKPEKKMVNLNDPEFRLGEQIEENIFRKMKWVIETLYKDLQDYDDIGVRTDDPPI